MTCTADNTVILNNWGFFPSEGAVTLYVTIFALHFPFIGEMSTFRDRKGTLILFHQPASLEILDQLS